MAKVHVPVGDVVAEGADDCPRHRRRPRVEHVVFSRVVVIEPIRIVHSIAWVNVIIEVANAGPIYNEVVGVVGHVIVPELVASTCVELDSVLAVRVSGDVE